MNQIASRDILATHPLAGLEGWPPTGPVYGVAEDAAEPRASTFWERVGERFRKSPGGDGPNPALARIWY